jgi:glutaredoxin
MREKTGCKAFTAREAASEQDLGPNKKPFLNN